MTRFKRNLLEESDLDPHCLIKRRYKWFYMFVAKLEHVNIHTSEMSSIEHVKVGCYVNG